eukprot:scaffold6534_cov64-Phaeocystis_antarctica.AAC.2
MRVDVEGDLAASNPNPSPSTSPGPSPSQSLSPNPNPNPSPSPSPSPNPNPNPNQVGPGDVGRRAGARPLRHSRVAPRLQGTLTVAMAILTMSHSRVAPRYTYGSY